MTEKIDGPTLRAIRAAIQQELSKATNPQDAAKAIAAGVTQYVGARYVPLFANPIQWDNARAFEPLTIVLHGGNSYTSRQYVPEGIDIYNEAFWVETGNYNAQIEQYRQEVRALDDEVGSAQTAANAANDKITAVTPFDEMPTQGSVKGVTSEGVANAVATEKAERLADSEKLTAQMAGTSASGLKDLIAREQSRAEKREFELAADSAMQSESIYLGNINLYETDPEYLSPQGGCLVDGIAYVSSKSGNSDSCIVYKINVATSEIIHRYEVAWGSCNSISYNPDDKMLYVCPCNTYVNGANTQVNKFYKVDPNTMGIVETVQMPFSPHSIYTDKVTGNMYMTSETLTPQHKIELYKFNKSDNSTAYVGTVPTDLSGTFHAKRDESYGTQTIKAWDGHLYYVLGGNGCNCLIELDETCKIIGVKSINVNVGPFVIAELEDVDFNDDGDLVCWSLAKNKLTASLKVGLITGTNMFGNKIVPVDMPIQSNTSIYKIYVDTTLNKNSVMELGSLSSPFKTLVNAIAAARFVRNGSISVQSDCVATNVYISNIGDINIRIAADKTLTLTNGFDAGNVIIERDSSTAYLSVPSKITAYSSKVILKNLQLTGEIGANGSVFILSGVNGGRCTGVGNSMLIKYNSTTTCSGFATPTTS